jgi:DNA-binding PadR family transcriptional regulator
LNNMEWTILGLLADGHTTGYDVLKLFRDSPAVPFRSSSGSVYPALKRVVGAGLAAVSGEEVGMGRRTITYEITPEGRSHLEQWLASPITATVPEATTDTVLRILFAHHGPPGLVTNVVRQYRGLVLAELEQVEAVSAACEGCLPAAHRYCLSNGRLSLRAQLDWADQILAAAADPTTPGGVQP